MRGFKTGDGVRLTKDVLNHPAGTEARLDEMDDDGYVKLTWPHKIGADPVWAALDAIERVGNEGPGRILSPNAILMRMEQATATDDNGNEYELGADITGLPYVFSEQTGRYWVLTREEMITLARAKGVDDVERCSLAKKEQA